MKKDDKEKSPDQTKTKKVMTYININKRMTELAKMGLLEEIKPDVHMVNIHGRKDYKLTNKGLPCLLDHIAEHSEDIEDLVGYMDRTNLDKGIFTSLLDYRAVNTLTSLNKYCKIARQPLPELKWDKEGRFTSYKIVMPKRKSISK